ncbi:sulfatase [Haloarchaeobius baliensis]|uniref:sulfatase n=1 Tax=Haloarchaeobius baliensis TaxID=1670458 RepID=UPI003F883698
MMEHNVVLIVMDTARATTLEQFVESGNSIFAELAESGQMYTNATATTSWTLPSHASLFTGTYPSKHGAHAGHKRLDDRLPVLAEILSDNGYETVAVSNNTWISEEFGFARGFETFYKTWQYVQSETDLGRVAREEEGMSKLWGALKALFDGNPATNLANAVYGQFLRKNEDDGASRTNDWVEGWLADRDRSRPFFLFINYLEPHLEYRPPKDHAEQHLPTGVSFEEAMTVNQDAWGYITDNIEMSDDDFEILRALYRAEISYLGEKIQSVVEMLESAGEWEETVFVVTSDHGEYIGDHGLMDHQYALYNPVLRVPLFIHGGPFGTGRVDDLVQLVDVAPTLLDALDIDASNRGKEFQGISFHPGSQETREYAFAEYLAPQPSMEALSERVGELSDDVRRYDRSLRTIRTSRFKYIRGSRGSQELYDIEQDADEGTNLADTRTEVRSELDQALDEWLLSFDHAPDGSEVTIDGDTKSRLEDLGYLQ